MSDVEDDVPMDYSESEGDSEFLSPPSRQMYATGASAFMLRSDSKSSRVVRFQSSSREESFDEEMPARISDSRNSSADSLMQLQHHRPPPPQKHRQQQPSIMWNAVSNLAMAVHRSPGPTRPTRKKGSTREYPHRVHGVDKAESSSSTRRAASGKASRSERIPLLKQQPPVADYGPFQKEPKVTKRKSVSDTPASLERRARQERKTIEIAASFLRDCERGRRPSLPSNLDSITDTLLSMCRWKYSLVWVAMVKLAAIALFLSCCFEGRPHYRWYSHICNGCAIVIFVLDMAMGSELRKVQHLQREHDPMLNLRESRLEQWTVLLAVLLFLLTMEIVLSAGMKRQALWSSALKPIALFYVSNQAKNALEALNRIGRIVTRVLVMELFVILSFAAVACRLYISYDSFHDLSTAFLSLFQCTYQNQCIAS